MPRPIFVKKARKANKVAGIKVGDSYWHWKFRHGGKHYSKTPPTRGQLTQSEFLGCMYTAEDTLADVATHVRDKTISAEDAQSECQCVKEEIEQQGESCQEKFDNMPDGLQQGETGQLLERRVESCESIASEIDSLDFGDIEEAQSELDALQENDKAAKEIEDRLQAARDELADAIESIGWDYE